MYSAMDTSQRVKIYKLTFDHSNLWTTDANIAALVNGAFDLRAEGALSKAEYIVLVKVRVQTLIAAGCLCRHETLCRYLQPLPPSN